MKRDGDIARILSEIGFFLEMEGSDSNKAAFKARAYQRASDVITNLSSNVKEIYKKQGLDGLVQIPLVGRAIASKIEEYITTGKIHIHEDCKEVLRRQSRAVRAEDYEEVLRRHPGIQGGPPALRWTGSWSSVYIAVDRHEGKEVDTRVTKRILAGYDLEIKKYKKDNSSFRKRGKR